MALNDQVKFTWVGHGTWKVRTAGGKDLLIDPFLTGNPAAPDHLKSVDRLDIMVITHGHGDHVADAVQVAKATGCKVLAPFEVGNWLTGQGVDGGNMIAFGKGGTVVVDGISFTMVHAEHFSTMPDGSAGGEPVGYVITFENGFRVYFSGDTDVFGDMALIRELEQPEVAFLSIGDFYTRWACAGRRRRSSCSGSRPSSPCTSGRSRSSTARRPNWRSSPVRGSRC
jgi:L-ascorbate metabolism protein UlaG (beta-lactamase superfamily)